MGKNELFSCGVGIRFPVASYDFSGMDFPAEDMKQELHVLQVPRQSLGTREWEVEVFVTWKPA